MMKGGSIAKAHHCHRCDRDFARLEHLKRHERSHTKEKPFRCLKCAQAFTRRSVKSFKYIPSRLTPRRDLLTRHDRLSHRQHSEGISFETSTLLQSSTEPIAAVSQAVDSAPESLFILREDLNAASSLQQLHGPLFAADQTTTEPTCPVSVSDTPIRRPLRPLVHDFGSNTLYNAADDFAAFLDSISLPIDPFSPTYQPLPYFSPSEHFDDSTGYVRWAPATDTNPPLGTLEGADFGLSRFGSRLPSIEPEDLPRLPDTTLTPKPRSHSFSKISPSCHEQIISELSTFSNVIEGNFVLPSRHALSRFMAGYMAGFHEHYPVLHIPTFSFESTSLELVLAIAALGATYCRERENSLKLFQVGKAVALERVRRQNLGRSIGTIQALLLLMAVAGWSERNPSAREALSIRSVLDWLVREEGLEQVREPADNTWESWVQFETVKRTVLVVFCFFNLHTIVFDIPPMLLSSELVFGLPCTECEWKAENASVWCETRNSSRPNSDFQHALQALFSGEENDKRLVPSFSSLGGYILIHAVIQHIWLLQQAARLPPWRGRVLSLTEATVVEHALKRWRYGWERDREASIGPLSPYGPLSFTSTALLRLAYIRINIDTGSIRSLSTWDPSKIATSLSHSPPIHRSEKVTRAALHCAHGLSIPIKLGINFVAHTQVFFWSNQHALCSLECALLLSKWLEAVTISDPEPPLTREECRLLNFVVQMVAETEYNAPPEQLFQDNKHLSAIVVRVWAKLFRSDSIWEMVDLIGRSLRAYANLLESKSI